MSILTQMSSAADGALTPAALADESETSSGVYEQFHRRQAVRVSEEEAHKCTAALCDGG